MCEICSRIFGVSLGQAVSLDPPQESLSLCPISPQVFIPVARNNIYEGKHTDKLNALRSIITLLIIHRKNGANIFHRFPKESEHQIVLFLMIASQLLSSFVHKVV